MGTSGWRSRERDRQRDVRLAAALAAVASLLRGGRYVHPDAEGTRDEPAARVPSGGGKRG